MGKPQGRPVVRGAVMMIDSPDRAREWLASWKGHLTRSRLDRRIKEFRIMLKLDEARGHTVSAETTREILAVLEAAEPDAGE